MVLYAFSICEIDNGYFLLIFKPISEYQKCEIRCFNISIHAAV